MASHWHGDRGEVGAEAEPKARLTCAVSSRPGTSRWSEGYKNMRSKVLATVQQSMHTGDALVKLLPGRKARYMEKPRTVYRIFPFISFLKVEWLEPWIVTIAEDMTSQGVHLVCHVGNSLVPPLSIILSAGSGNLAKRA